MDKEITKRAWIGLIVGFISGCGVNYLLLLLQNWLSTWTSVKSVEITFWNILPFGIVMGLSTVAIMRSGYLGD